MAGERVKIVHLFASPHGLTCRIALAEKKVRYELQEVHKFRSSMATLEGVNERYKSLPAFIHNGKEIYEFRTIVEYIDEVWKGQSALLPIDPYQRAQARYWFDFIDTKFSEDTKVWSGKGQEQEAAKNELISTLKELEAELGDKPYFGGETLGLVDVVLIPHYAWFRTYETCADFCIRAHCPKLIKWIKRCLKRESVSNCLPDPEEVYEYAMRLKERGDEIAPVVAMARLLARLAGRSDSSP